MNLVGPGTRLGQGLVRHEQRDRHPAGLGGRELGFCAHDKLQARQAIGVDPVRLWGLGGVHDLQPIDVLHLPILHFARQRSPVADALLLGRRQLPLRLRTANGMIVLSKTPPSTASR